MKLKRLFWAKNFAAIFFAAGLLLNISCSSTKLAVPIPGQSDAVISNIYIEYQNIADIYYGLEKFDKAETYYKAAMGNKDIYWNAYYKLAKCYVYQSKWGDAQTAYDTMLKRDPENASLKSSIAYIYAMNGSIDKSIELYENLIEETPESVEFLENYICVLLVDGQKEKASEQYDILKEKFPDSKRLEELSKQIAVKEEGESTVEKDTIASTDKTSAETVQEETITEEIYNKPDDINQDIIMDEELKYKEELKKKQD